MDSALREKGFPELSPFWRREVARFFRSGRRRSVKRCGRRGGKSTTACKAVIAWAWFGSWYVPPGDDPVVTIVSVNRVESAARLKTIAAMLDALGLKYEERGDEIEMVAPRVVFRTFAATTSAVVGHTSICIIADEAAQWESRDTSANPAREVAGTMRPTMATQLYAFEWWLSRPWGTDDYHAEMFDQGDTEHQTVSYAPTWIANPTISEERTRELEPDERVWSREYAAVPGATVTAAIDGADLAACFGRSTPTDLGNPFVAIDASSLRGDAFSWLCGAATDEGEIVVTEAGGFEGEQLRHVSSADVVAKIAGRAQAHGVSTIFGDQREEAALRSLFNQHSLTLQSYAWSEPSKDAAMQLIRRWMREHGLYLPEHPRLRSELASMKARLLPSGRIKYETGGLDYASALITLAHAIVAKDFYLGAARRWRLSVPKEWARNRPIQLARRKGEMFR